MWSAGASVSIGRRHCVPLRNLDVKHARGHKGKSPPKRAPKPEPNCGSTAACDLPPTFDRFSIGLRRLADNRCLLPLLGRHNR
jgi:hypothetical protein